MIESINFMNFKALRDTTLNLGRFTLIVGPNGSGKSTVLQALTITSAGKNLNFKTSLSTGVTEGERIAIAINWDRQAEVTGQTTCSWSRSDGLHVAGHLAPSFPGPRVYSLNATAIAARVGLEPKMELDPEGRGLAGVLDRLRDEAPERFEALNTEFGHWLPEFDRILFDTPHPGQRAIALRTSQGSHRIPASELSQGTLLALAMLTLAYLPDPPPIVGFEEPDRGIHPRLLRDVRDALYRLAYPESIGEKRQPVQVIATTHSPYLLDLFRDHPEEIVVAQKEDSNVRFQRLSDMPEIKEILEGAPLGDVWYSGVLGGVPGDK